MVFGILPDSSNATVGPFGDPLEIKGLTSKPAFRLRERQIESNGRSSRSLGRVPSRLCPEGADELDTEAVRADRAVSAPARETRMRLSTLCSIMAGFVVLSMASCDSYSTKGGWLPSSNSTFTYISTSSSPKTIRIIDTRNEEAFFTLRLPVGKQLTFRFLDGKGDDPIYTPDRMQWEIWDAPKKNGRLSNQLTVPPAAARSIRVEIRPVPEWPEDDERYRLRIDADADRPDHWTPQGGPIPDESSTWPN